jgi:hypothetical protein
MVNRTQRLVLGFLALVVVSVLAIRVAAPRVYDQALGLPSGQRRWQSIMVAGYRRGGIWGAF